MIEGFEMAQGEIAVAAARDLPWFAPPERKQFLGEAILSAFAALLLSAFIAGFKEAAEEKSKVLGKKVFEYLWEAITDLFSDKKESAAKKELDKRAVDACNTTKNLTEEEIVRLFAEVKKELKVAIQTKTRLSPKRAEKLADRVQQAVLKHVLNKWQIK